MRPGPNRLAKESSPYLRQHALNPVDWYPWGEEAFAKAKREDKPIFLSIGYSSCHWCHVMERESFENEEIASVLNERFVAIKVDREERPDVDDVYMTSVQLTTGRGGWPLSAFLLPDGRPFFGGTYFAPDDRHGRPGFRTLLTRLSETFHERRADVEELAGRLTADIDASQRLTSGRGKAPLGPETADALSDALASSFDETHGGFGGAPKFPPHLAIAWWLGRGAASDAAALGRASKTLEAMALGGIHDHLGGGFHRYSTDERWLLPHFEKMLTDNAQLLGLYAEAWAATGGDLFQRTARDIGDYLLREMRGPEGGFFAATDADSEGEEGKYFVWDPVQIRECLGESDGSFFCEWYSVRPEGNYLDEATGRSTGLSVLHLSRKISSSPGAEERLAPLRHRLLDARAKRIPPSLDDKRVAGWVALAVSGFARAGRLLGEPRYLEAARSAARFLQAEMRDGTGRLQRTWKDGEAKIPAFLEDEALLAHALLDLAEAEDGSRADGFLADAKACVGAFARFRREDGPGLAFTGEGHETLLTRGRDLFDKAIPSASGSAAFAQARLARKTGDAALAREAAEAVSDVSWLLARSPHGTESWHLALVELLEFDSENPEAGVGALLSLRGEGSAGGVIRRTAKQDAGHFSSKVKRAELGRGGLRSGFGEGVLSCLGPSKHRAKRGAASADPADVPGVAHGWHLQGADGIRIEAWGGSDFTFEETRPRPNSTVTGEEPAFPAFSGYFRSRSLLFRLPAAASGQRTISVVVTYRACGEGACRPEAALTLSIPVEVV